MHLWLHIQRGCERTELDQDLSSPTGAPTNRGRRSTRCARAVDGLRKAF